MKYFPEIRNDDVLQISGFSEHQLKCIGNKTLFELFKEADEPFKKSGYPCTLAICARGIEEYPEWVKYIKENQKRFRIELHCWEHKNYVKLSPIKIMFELKYAKQKIEETFGVKVNIWYPPKGRKGEPVNKDKLCEEIGLKCYQQFGKVDAKLWFKNNKKYPHVNFHYWHKGQVDVVKRIIKLWQLKHGNI